MYIMFFIFISWFPDGLTVRNLSLIYSDLGDRASRVAGADREPVELIVSTEGSPRHT